MIEKLDDKNIELTKILFDLKQSLDIYKLLSLNATKINKKAGKTFLTHAQRLALKSFVLDICKIFEEKKKNKLNSIPSIIDFIQGSKVEPKHSEIIEKYIQNHGEKITKKLHYGTTLKRILQSFKDKHQKDFERFKRFRDSKVAHAEDKIGGETTYLPSCDVMEKLLFFGIDFYSMIHKAYVGGFPVDHKKDKRVFSSLYSILSQMGHKNIKKDFDK